MSFLSLPKWAVQCSSPPTRGLLLSSMAEMWEGTPAEGRKNPELLHEAYPVKATQNLKQRTTRKLEEDDFTSEAADVYID